MLIAAGRVRSGRLNGDTVKIVHLANDDGNGVATGYLRENEAVAAAGRLGVTEQNVIFLGYGAGTLNDMYRAPPTQVFTSPAGQTSTYANRGLGGMDYHRYLTGASASYTRANIVSDLRAVLTNFNPDEIYTTHYFDAAPDPHATVLFLWEAAVSLRSSGTLLSTKIYQALVFEPGTDWSSTSWPYAGANFTPSLPYQKPPSITSTPFEWERIKRFPVPPEMQSLDPSTNLKASAIQTYTSGLPLTYVRKDESYWLTDLGVNLAPAAQASASSESWYPTAASKAINGVIDGTDHDWIQEWVSSGELAGAWLQLTWAPPVSIGQINLYDRPSLTENILSAILSFSDGSSLPVGALPPDGKMLPITFPRRTVTWVRLTINQVQGTAAGLAEIEVFGLPADSTVSLPPTIMRGPVPALDTVGSTQSTTLAIDATTLSGTPLQYAWTADQGSITIAGGTVTFNPPPPSTGTTVATINAQARDGAGLSTSNVTFITIQPGDAIALNPTAVSSGTPSQGTLSLANAAPSGGISIGLSSSNPTVASVPSSVLVPGGSTSANFTVTTYPVSSTTNVTITASFAGGPKSATLAVSPPAASLSSVATSPTSVTGGTSSTGTVTLTGAAGTGGVVINLASSDPAASVPANVTVIAGASSATFPITTSPVSVTTNVTITATQGSITRTAPLTVNPAVTVSGLSLNPTTVTGGQNSTGTITLSGGAPPGFVVAVSSNNTAAQVPSSVAVPAGSTSTPFTVTTSPVSSPVTATITAGSRTATLVVQPGPLTVSNLVLSPSTVVGGNTSTGTVSLSGAPSSAVVVTLSSSNGSATVPASVTVLAGTTTASFNINTTTVTTPTSATITASYSASSRSATLSIVPATGRTVLVIGPHPDDEALIGAGIARSALTRGDTIKMVLMTNGDTAGSGYVRQAESVAAAQVLGLREQDVIFLGYGGGILNDMYRSSSDTQVFTDGAGFSATFGNRGLGGVDYHRYLYGVSAPYTRANIIGDLKTLFQNFAPNEIYTVNYYDKHSDHQATSLLIIEALLSLVRSGATLSPKLFQSLVWDPGTDWSPTCWPYVSGNGFTPTLVFQQPSSLNNHTLDWSLKQSFPVPPEMTSNIPSANMKYNAIYSYTSQFDQHLISYARANEFFWPSDVGQNVAFTATVTASSEDWYPHGAAKAVNGVIDGSPHDWIQEWVSGELAGAWIQLGWTNAVAVAQVNLYDRPNTTENVLAGRLTFSDGSSIAIGALPTNGRRYSVSFPAKLVTWVRFTITQAQGTATGLAEIEVLRP